MAKSDFSPDRVQPGNGAEGLDADTSVTFEEDSSGGIWT